MAGYDVAASFGIEVEFLTSDWSAQLVEIDGPNFTRDAIDVTHQGVGSPTAGKVGNRLYIPSDLVDGGEVTMTMHFNPDDTPPVHLAEENVQITWPKAASDTTAATWTFPAFVTSWGASAPLGEKMTIDVTLKVAGEVSIVAAT